MRLGKIVVLAAALGFAPFAASTAVAQNQPSSYDRQHNDSNANRDRTDRQHNDSNASRDRTDRRSDRNASHHDWRRHDRGRHYGWHHGRGNWHRHCRWMWHHHHRVRVCRR
jgi:hypothetical protein